MHAGGNGIADDGEDSRWMSYSGTGGGTPDHHVLGDQAGDASGVAAAAG